MFFVTFFISLALMVVGELLRPKQNPQNAKPASIDEFDLPTAEAGRAIPVIAGKVKIDGANTTYYGDLKIVPLTKKVKTGIFSSKKQTYAYKYYLGAQMFLCHARDDLDVHEIRFGDKMPTRHTRSDGGNGIVNFNFFDDNFFGGNEKEGGISGLLRFYRGHIGQPPSAYFSARIGETAPAYEEYAYAMLEQMYLGTSAYIKPISFILSSYPNTLGLPSNHHKIDEDANPVCFIYEIMTNSVWGLNINPGRVDTQSFVYAAETVFAEGYGISMIVNSAADGESLVDEILRHIDGVIFTDPETGLSKITLARADYDVNTIPEFGPDDFVEGLRFERASWSETKNTIKVNFISRIKDYQPDIAPQQDLANIVQREGEIASESIDFLGFTKFSVADLAAARALKTYAYPLAKAICPLTRRAWKLRPGSVFKLTWPARGIDAVVMRVVRIDYGNLDKNRIDIEATEDIFSISTSAYSTPPPSGWVDPISAPVAFARQAGIELPYGMAAATDAAYVASLASRNSGIDEGYDIWSTRTSGTYEEQTRVFDFTPSGRLVANYPANTAATDATGFLVDQMIDPEGIEATVSSGEMLSGARLALISSLAGQEIVAFQGFTNQGDGSYRLSPVVRAAYDGVPLTHAAGARVWFLSEGYGLENEDYPYAAARSIDLKLLPFNVRGVLDIAAAPIIPVTVAMRANKPYPPANLKIDGTVDPPTVTGSATLTWAIRHRVVQGNAVVPQDAASTAAAPEGSYTVRVYIDGAVRRTVSVATTPFNTFDYTTTMRTADYADVTKSAHFGVTAVNGALSSVERLTGEFFMLDLLNPLVINTNMLPSAIPSTPYSFQIIASGGAAPYTFTITAGALPAGFSMSSSGLITGSSAIESIGSFTVRVEGPTGITATKPLSLVVSVECADYMVPVYNNVQFNLVDAEEPISGTNAALHVCERVLNSPTRDPFRSNVIVHMHFDGTNGSTDFFDELGTTWTALGNAQITTVTPKFDACALFDGAGDRVTTTGTSAHVLGAGDYTFECFVRTTANSGVIFNNYSGGQTGYELYVDPAGKMAWYTTTLAMTSPLAYNDGNWHHVAVTRSGTTLRMFVDGAQVATATSSVNHTYARPTINIGSEDTGFYYNGRIDELRITRGVARYTAAFTPPTVPFKDY